MYLKISDIKKLIELMKKSDDNIEKRVYGLIYDRKEVNKIKNQNKKIFFEANKKNIEEFFNKKDKNLLEIELEKYFIDLKKEIYE